MPPIFPADALAAQPQSPRLVCACGTVVLMWDDLCHPEGHPLSAQLEELGRYTSCIAHYDAILHSRS